MGINSAAASELAKVRWGKLSPEERQELMRRAAHKGWTTRRKGKQSNKKQPS